eukprot:6209198-Pleurochrysis_carterae.AAC.1
MPHAECILCTIAVAWIRGADEHASCKRTFACVGRYVAASLQARGGKVSQPQACTCRTVRLACTK